MFALFNPPHAKFKGKRRQKKNVWFGDPEGHRAAAKKGWAKRRKRVGAKLKRASQLFTPGGGRIFSVAANPRPLWLRRTKRNTFMGINPTNNNGGNTMSRRRGGRRARFNMGGSLGRTGLLNAFNPKNLVGVMPILAGVIADGLATKVLSDKIPYTKRGLGNIALGIATAGGIGMLTRWVTKNRQISDGVFVGGVVGTLGCAFQSFMQSGLSSLSLGNWDSPFTNYGFNGMGTFVTPQAIGSAISSESSISQYALPAANAQFMPQMQMPQTPAQGASARHMVDYESGAIGSVLGQDEGVM